jgi:mycothiol synthase
LTAGTDGGRITAVRQFEDDDLPAAHRIGASAFIADPAEGAALVTLLTGRPGQQPELNLVAFHTRAEVVGFAVGSVREGVGYLDAIAVTATHRGQGVGRDLLGALEPRLAAAGAHSLRIGGNSWFYAWPGLDAAYSDALRLGASAGYRRCGVIQNMSLSLRGWVPGSADSALHDPASTVVRRAEPGDAAALDAFVSQYFSRTWRREALLALDRPVPTVFVAVRDQHLVGFGCHGVYRRTWFGPLGTAPGQRSGGIGEALLRRCLDDLAAAGAQQAEIGWIGPAGFYTRTVGARCDRQFALFEKELDARVADLAL